MMLDLLGYGAFFLVTALSYAIICLGLNIQWGQTGLFNVGVAGFVAVGAYASALLTTPATRGPLRRLELPIAIGWIGAMIAAAMSARASSASSPCGCAPTIWPSPPSASPSAIQLVRPQCAGG